MSIFNIFFTDEARPFCSIEDAPLLIWNFLYMAKEYHDIQTHITRIFESTEMSGTKHLFLDSENFYRLANMLSVYFEVYTPQLVRIVIAVVSFSPTCNSPRGCRNSFRILWQINFLNSSWDISKRCLQFQHSNIISDIFIVIFGMNGYLDNL